MDGQASLETIDLVTSYKHQTLHCCENAEASSYEEMTTKRASAVMPARVPARISLRCSDRRWRHETADANHATNSIHGSSSCSSGHGKLAP